MIQTHHRTSIDPEQVGHVAWRIKSEYEALPGLSLTGTQAQRFWSLDALHCEAVLWALVRVGFLRRTHDGRYVRAGH